MDWCGLEGDEQCCGEKSRCGWRTVDGKRLIRAQMPLETVHMYRGLGLHPFFYNFALLLLCFMLCIFTVWPQFLAENMHQPSTQVQPQYARSTYTWMTICLQPNKSVTVEMFSVNLFTMFKHLWTNFRVRSH